MVPPFRYHLLTMIGIFLALGVGIAIGTSFVQGPLVEQQTRRLDDLRNQYNNQVLVAQESLRAYNEFMAAIGPRLTQGRLAGLRIAIVQTGDYPDTVRKTRDALEQAGAKVSSETVVERMFAARARMVRDEVIPKLAAFPEPLMPGESALLKVLAYALARGGADYVGPLADARLIRTDGDYAAPNDWVVIIGGASDEAESRAESVDLPLIQQIKEYGAKVLAAEPSKAAISYVPALHAAEVSTVDNAETDIGRLAVVLALKAERGNYGIKPTADSGILPPFNADDLRRHSSL
jgi:hypothetical protein